jgi:predicted NBD/HSP70 family sugar kinase
MNKSFSAPDIRERNYRVVFDMARRSGELSRPTISKYTGMTPPTVMKVVQSFVERGILVEAGEAETTALGRRPTRLLFNSGAALAIGILLEGGEMHAGLVDLSGTVLRNMKIPMEHAFNESTLPVIFTSIEKLMEGIHAPVLGIGLGVPGVVDASRNIVEFAPLIGIVNPMDCTQLNGLILNKTGLPVVLENDVNAAAIGEYFFRKLPEDDDLLYITVGTGIGAGIILSGKLHRGSRNLAGELGYAVQNASFRVDRTRPGWLESQIGLDSLQRQFNWQGYCQNDDIPEGLIDFLVDHLAPVVSNLSTQLDIRLVVLGGRAFDCMGDLLFQPLAEKIERLSLEPGEVQRSHCTDPGVAGAAMQAITKQLDSWLTIREAIV